ncbi:hypothetical protein [Planctomicrobium piriforme]|uniref:CopZ zinc binding domain-containing protein n=1 Tax=Planctomicrobium piriforme TaxID=1576369 RepID=A0A1I3EPI5_9PLAN|nr:hypothetical protein [Planctomicrobium piriforme]SFI00905.1 hypothetical protein SAMN05421753_104318 [Planctomicrobium piriforme]
MNKAFVREPDDDGRAFCPRCGALGTPVTSGPLDQHVVAAARSRLGASAWFCAYPPCEVAYFDAFDSVVLVSELQHPVYPKDTDASLCACFGFSLEDIQDDVDSPTPVRIRELLAKSQSPEARCQTLAPDGRCCMAEIKRLYMKLREQR